MKTKEKTRRLVESALLLAVGTVLSELALAKLPYGGSITVASMLPVMLIAYRYGTPWGLFCGVLYGVIQQLLGLSTLSYFTTWQSIVAIIVLDYVVAFAVIGVAGAFRRLRCRQPFQLLCGALTASVLRYACHVVSGATVWAGLSIPTEAALAYSFIYNATYMLPEAIVLCAASYYLGSVLFFGQGEIRRMPLVATPDKRANVITLCVGLLALGALVFDTVMVFSRLQDAETGEFTLQNLPAFSLADGFWLSLLIVTAVAVLACVALAVWRKCLSCRAHNE